MFGGREEEKKILPAGGMMIGYDLSGDSAQISYYQSTMDEPGTAALVTGTEIYNIPALLCKRPGVNQWFYGKEALRFHEETGAYLVDHILEKALEQEVVVIEETEYDPVALLTLFVKRSLVVLGMIVTPDKIGSFMFTVEHLDDRMVEVLGAVSANLGLRNATVYFQSYQESLYHYMMYQKEDLWRQKVLVCDFNGAGMHYYIMEKNLRTTPVVVLIKDGMAETMFLPDEDLAPELLEDAYQNLDSKFLRILEPILEGEFFSAVYLLGDGFKEQWMNGSIRYLCRNRRVFQGNNLFSRGACYSLKDKVSPGEASVGHVYLGKEKLISNVGMQVRLRDDDTYFALLDAGVNWYETYKEVEIFLPEDGQLELMITPLDGQPPMTKVIQIPELPERPVGTSRARVTLKMISATKLEIGIEDLGFGEIFPSTGKEWNYEFEVR